MVGYPCCCNPSLECAACENDKGPIYWEVTISGLFAASDCVACDRYNDTTFTLAYFTDNSECTSDATSFADYCCWYCFINSFYYVCADGLTPNELKLSIFDNQIVVELAVAGSNPVKWLKDYETAIDCTTLEDDLDWDSNSGGNCEGDALSTVHIKAVSEVNPNYACCRDPFYPDCTPNTVTCVIANIQNDTCSDCGDLNGTYVLSRIQPRGSQLQCYVAFFDEVCGMDCITVFFAVGGTGAFQAILHNFANYPSGNAMIFDSSFPYVDVASTPYAECSNFNGLVARLSGDQGVCLAGDGSTYDSGDPSTYATATLTV